MVVDELLGIVRFQDMVAGLDGPVDRLGNNCDAGENEVVRSISSAALRYFDRLAHVPLEHQPAGGARCTGPSAARSTSSSWRPNERQLFPGSSVSSVGGRAGS